jgi:orotidine-5'-phosphate decarboxylase
MPKPHLKTYGDRAENATNPTAKLLLQTMERKKTNLAVSVDVTTSDDFLGILEAVGPYVCLIKASIFHRPGKT